MFSAGLGCAEQKRSEDCSEEDYSFPTNIFPISHRSNLDQFRSNSPTAYYPANAGHKALCAAFGDTDCKNFDIIDV